MNKDQEYLNNLRHSTAHLLAAAILELHPEAKPTIGPPIDNGFYYDFDNLNISDTDFDEIEKKMRELVKSWKSFDAKEVNEKEAGEMFQDNPYKLELIADFAIEKKEITVHTSGTFTDLCKGGHTLNPSKDLKHFKLLSVAGAYWKGSESNKMLTRIYGTAFPTQKELDDYVSMMEEAKKRDHKKLGKELDLFTFSDKVGGGLPLWTPRGTLIRNLLDEFVWQLREEKGYEKVEIPHITKKELFETSGHWDKFADELFKITTREGHVFAMKPMNCPFHTQIFDRKSHSYREMPQRYANTTMVYRDEQSGELSGLSRVRSITQDDAHVFCRETQVQDEVYAVWDIIEKFYEGTGFGKLKIRLSLHDPNHFEKYLGTKESWGHAESQLRSILKDRKAEFYEAQGEAAFYGPKIDFMSYDSLGRQWQVATIQVDRNMPERFSLYCINEKGDKESIVMIHAAIMGAIERFMSVIIEHFSGNFPVWISPVQVSILPITDRNLDYSNKVLGELKSKGIRADLDETNETLGNKIRKAQGEKVPYMLIIGDKEESANKVAVRQRDGKDLGQVTLSDFVQKLQDNISIKSLEL